MHQLSYICNPTSKAEREYNDRLQRTVCRLNILRDRRNAAIAMHRTDDLLPF